MNVTTALEALQSAQYYITEGYAANVLSDLLTRVILEYGVPHIHMAEWRCESPLPESFSDVRIVRTFTNESRWQALGVSYTGVLVHLSWDKGRIALTSAGDHDECLALVTKLQEQFPELPPPEDRVRITTWANSRRGAQRWERQIDAPQWESIQTNYAATTRVALSEMMAWEPPATVSGRLILWHGRTGGGKTWAIRSLARAWRSWCELHYITDPETLFGSEPSYLMEVTMNEDQHGPPIHGSSEDEDNKWRLIILEDCGEMLSRDAKERVGQGLARLLNLSDGLLGQGLRILLLVTTNEELGQLHPAVQRAGRCIAQVDFASIPWDQAEAWLHDHGHQNVTAVPDTRNYMLADLYQLLHSGRVSTTTLSTPGFRH